MNSFIIHAIIVGGAFVMLFLLHVTRLSSTLLRSRLAQKAFKHFIWPAIVRRTRFTPPVTRGDIVAQLLYWGGTLVVNVFRVRSLPEAASRAGSIALLHLIPLMAGNRLSFVADMIGLSLRTFQYLHNTMGLMVSAQLICHVVLLFRIKGVKPLEMKDRYGIIAGCSIITIAVAATPFARRLAYEIFLWIHGYLPILAIYSIWYHIGKQRHVERILLLIGIGIFALFDIIRFARILYQNFARKQTLVKASAVERSGAVLIQLDLPRQWKLQPGDFIYLRCLSISFRSLFESHPFSIAWWDEDGNVSGHAVTIYLLVSPQYGFTSQLLHRSNHNRPLHMAIDGPYGKMVKTSNYDTILLFATGIGIAALMPFIKETIDDHKKNRISARRMSLIWEIGRESDEGWVTNWMNEMLEADEAKMLHFSLYVTEASKQPGTLKYFGKRGKGIYGKCCVPRVMDIEMELKVGRTLILVAAGARVRDQLRELMPKYVDEDVHLELLDFDPLPEREGFRGRYVKEIDYEGVVEYK